MIQSEAGQRIAEALQRLNAALDRRHGFGRHTGSSLTTLGDGLRCETEAGGWTIVSDLGPAFGGEGAAPTPSILLSSALGACLAMGYRLRVAEDGIELTSVRVTIETDSELCGMLRCGAEVPPGFTEIRYRVDIDSPAPASDIERIVDRADRLSPVLDELMRVNKVRRVVSINERLPTWTSRSSAGCNGTDGIEPWATTRPTRRSNCGPPTRGSWPWRIDPGQHVIDIACGTGMVTLPAATAVGHAGDVLATDLSQTWWTTPRRRARHAGRANVEVRCCDAEQLDATGPFDRALCSLGLMYVPSPPAAISEMHRVLRPGGTAAVSAWGERRNCGWAEPFPIVDARVSSDVCPMFLPLGTDHSLAGLIERGGFTDVEHPG